MYRIHVGMVTIASFMRLIEIYCQACGLAESTVSYRLFNDGKRVGDVRGGADIGIRRVERAMQWFSDNWPVTVEWPHDVPRPVPASKIPEAAE